MLLCCRAFASVCVCVCVQDAQHFQMRKKIKKQYIQHHINKISSAIMNEESIENRIRDTTSSSEEVEAVAESNQQCITCSAPFSASDEGCSMLLRKCGACLQALRLALAADDGIDAGMLFHFQCMYLFLQMPINLVV